MANRARVSYFISNSKYALFFFERFYSALQAHDHAWITDECFATRKVFVLRTVQVKICLFKMVNAGKDVYICHIQTTREWYIGPLKMEHDIVAWG